MEEDFFRRLLANESGRGVVFKRYIWGCVIYTNVSLSGATLFLYERRFFNKVIKAPNEDGFAGSTPAASAPDKDGTRDEPLSSWLTG